MKWRTPLRWDEQMEFGNHPVTGVSWYEAAAFCNWAESRLPTEAEWERAAAGADGRRFPWGDQLPDHSFANYDRTWGGVTPVGVFSESASAEMVNDLAGNVWEWVNDEYDSGRNALRGGCHQNGWRFLRTSARIGARPDERYTNFGQTGFRCVRTRGIDS
jgi:formylglycine-generating enzyme required for sulfatase activity